MLSECRDIHTQSECHVHIKHSRKFPLLVDYPLAGLVSTTFSETDANQIKAGRLKDIFRSWRWGRSKNNFFLISVSPDHNTVLRTWFTKTATRWQQTWRRRRFRFQFLWVVWENVEWSVEALRYFVVNNSWMFTHLIVAGGFDSSLSVCVCVSLCLSLPL